MRSRLEKCRGLRFGVFEADLVRQELRKHGIRIKLPCQPFQALVLLLQARGAVVTRGELRTALWPDQPWGDHDQRLNSIINKMREALCDSAETPHFIETLPRVGYRFLASVETIHDLGQKEPEPVDIPKPHTPPLSTVPLLAPSAGSKRTGGKSWWLALPAALTAAVLIAGFEYRVSANRSHPYGSLAPVPLTTYVGSELYPSFSPDGKEIVFSANGDQESRLHVFVTSVTGGGARQLTNGEHNDIAPVWSPDGKSIAFLRETSEDWAELWLVHPDALQPRRLASIRRSSSSHPISWTKDSAWLVASEGSPDGGPPALFLLSASDGAQRQITSAAMQFGGDLSPAVSPDGRRIAFTRATGFSWRDVFIVQLSSDLIPVQEPVRVTDLKQIVDSVAWSPDGARLVISAATTGAGARHLFSVDVNGSLPVRSALETAIEGRHPALSPNGAALAYARNNLEQSSVWRLELSGDPAAPRQTRLISSTRRDYTADISPDGEHLVFSSVRSGPSEIWTSNTDGSGLKRITSLGASTPRWSPDGRRIAFESNTRGQPDIYVFDLSTSALRQVSSAAGRNLRPSWSRDGKAIYFASNSSGRSQIWKVPADGGQPVQITRNGGVYAIEAFDSKALYFTTAGRPAAVWTTSTSGGEETPVLTNVAGYSAIAMSRDGLYYLSSATDSGAQLDFYQFQTKTSRPLATIHKPVHHFLSSPPDGRSVLYTQTDRQDSDLMLVETFR